MAKCIYCDAETNLYINGKPVCLSCADALDAGRKPQGGEELERPKARIAPKQ